MVVAFTTKYSEVGMIFENAEKVEAILDDDAKKEILINNVVGTTFQAVRKMSNLRAASDSKSSALQKFINVDIPEERLRALAGSMGNQLTRNDLLNFKAVYDSLYDDQTVPKIPFANVLTLSPSGILFSEGIRTEHRTMEVKTPITPTSIVKRVEMWEKRRQRSLIQRFNLCFFLSVAKAETIRTFNVHFIASVSSYPPQAPPPPSFMPTFGWGQFGPSPEQSGGPLQSRHGAEAAYWANATGGYMPPYARTLCIRRRRGLRWGLRQRQRRGPRWRRPPTAFYVSTAASDWSNSRANWK